MSKINEFLNEIGLSTSQIKELENPETDIEVIIAEWQRSNLELVKAKENLKSETEIQNQFRTFQKGIIKKQAKILGMEMTDAKANEIAGQEKGMDLFLAQADQFYNQRVLELQAGTDEKTKEELNALRQEKANLLTKIDEATTTYETEMTKVNKDWEQKYNQKEVDVLLQNEFSKIEWDDKDKADIYKDYIKSLLNEHGLKINHVDGSVTKADGTAALSLNGKSVYKSIKSENPNENPLLDFALQKKMVAVSNGGVNGTPEPRRTTAGDKPMEFDGEAAKAIARFEAKNIKI